MMNWERFQRQWTRYFWFNEETMKKTMYKAYLVYQQVMDETPRTFFSGTTVHGTTLLNWECAWFFSRDCAMLTGNHRDEEQFLFFPIRNRVTSLSLNNRPTTIGQLSVTFTLDDGTAHTLEAWGNYCEVLKDIIVNYLKPNLKLNSGPHQERETTALHLRHARSKHPLLRP